MSEDSISGGYGIGEFAAFSLVRDVKDDSFTIVLKGPLRFAQLIANKLDELRVTPDELREWDEEE